MDVNAVKEELKSKKTQRALDLAMFALLEKHSFRKITAKDIYEEAFLSKATFYTYFWDKYDFLKYWLRLLGLKNNYENCPYEQMESKVNDLVGNNTEIIKNVLCEADDETLGIISDFLLFTLGLIDDENNKSNPQITALSSFYSGGIISYLSWLVLNKFPLEVTPMNTYLYKVYELLMEWKAE